MKNREVFKITQLLGSIGLKTPMVVLDCKQKMSVGALLMSGDDIYLCIDDEISLNANNYLNYVLSESMFEVEGQNNLDKLNELMGLNVKVFLGNILNDTPSNLDNIKEIKSIRYEDNILLFKI